MTALDAYNRASAHPMQHVGEASHPERGTLAVVLKSTADAMRDELLAALEVTHDTLLKDLSVERGQSAADRAHREKAEADRDAAIYRAASHLESLKVAHYEREDWRQATLIEEDRVLKLSTELEALKVTLTRERESAAIANEQWNIWMERARKAEAALEAQL